jgi:hypothetical protein
MKAIQLLMYLLQGTLDALSPGLLGIRAAKLESW